MASLNEIKKRIKIIESTSKITNAMKLVATAKLKKQREIFENQKVYYQNFYKSFHIVKNQLDKHFFVDNENKEAKKVWILIFSNMGLCGSFNLNVFKKIESEINEKDEIIVIGKKGKNILKSKNINNKILWKIEIDDKDIDYDLFYVLARNLISIYKKDDLVSGINLVYTKFINSLSFKPEILKIVPLSYEGQKNDEFFSVEPCPEEIMEQLIIDYLATCIFGGIIESKVCENASRRNAMETATKNAEELKRNYKLEFNRKRQANITQEITEVISGTNIGE